MVGCIGINSSEYKNALLNYEIFHSISENNNLDYAGIKEVISKNEPNAVATRIVSELSKEKYMNINSKISDVTVLTDLIEGIKLGVHFYDNKIEIAKILDYYNTATNAKEIYTDMNTYNYLRRKSVETFNSIKPVDVRQFIIKSTDKDFLKSK